MARRHGLVVELAFGCLLALHGRASGLELSRFWVAPEPGPKTIVLFHFDGDLKDVSANGANASAARADGAAELVKDGKFGGALRLAGGRVEIHLKQPLKTFVIEMWIKPDRLPAIHEKGRQAVLLDRAFRPGQQKWMQLLLCSDGSLLWRHSRRGAPGGGGDAFMCSLAGAVKAGAWQHVGLIVGPGESAAERVYVNGRNVSAGPYAPWLDVPDDPPGTISLGRRESDTPIQDHWERIGQEVLDRVKFRGDALVPFEGLIDEFRITSGALDFSPEPNNSFSDPDKKLGLETDPGSIPAAEDLLFYASFDSDANAELARGDWKSWSVKELQLVPGVYGKAILIDRARTGAPMFHAKGNFSGEAGTVMFWVRPQRKFAWAGVMFGADGFYFSPYILVSNNYWAHEPVYPGGDLFPPEQWTHVAWTWSKRVAVLYINGKEQYAVPMKPGATLKQPNTMGLSSFSGADAFDELKIFRRPLIALEIQNQYALYKPETLIWALPDLGATVVDLRGANKLAGSISSRKPNVVGAATVDMEILRDQTPVVRQTFPVRTLGDTPFVLELPESMQAGRFILRLAMKNGDGKVVLSGEQPLHRPEYPWLHGSAGKEERVLKPFTPIRREGSVVKVVGRDFAVNADGLFEKIDCWGEGLLAAPMRLEAKDAVAQGSGAKFTLEKPTKIAWQAASRIALTGGRAIAVDLTGDMDYDGTTKFTLTYGPAREGEAPAEPSVRLDGLSLVIPIPSRCAELYTWNIGGYMGMPSEAERQEVDLPWETRLKPGDGEVFSSLRTYHSTCPGNMAGDSTSKYRLPTVGNYIPQVWFGNNQRGISLFGDSDKGWVPDNDKPAIQVIRKGDMAEIQLNFISAPFELTKPRTIVFGFLPTPVRPLPADFRTRHLVDDFFPFGAGTAYVADYEDPRNDIPGLRAAVETRHRQGLFAQPHVNGTYFEPGRETRRLFAAEWHDGMGFAPFTMVTPSKVDYIAWYYSHLKKDIGIDGTYFDCCTPQPNFNTLSGTAYLLDDGRVQPGWTIWSERDLFKRVSNVFGDLFAPNLFWGNGFYGPELNGWQIGTVVGEGCEVFTKDNKELVGRHNISEKDHWGFLPLRDYADTIVGQFPFERIHAISEQWGLIRFWQGPNYLFFSHPGWQKDPPELVEKVERFQRSANSQLLLLDTRLTWCGQFPPYYAKFMARPGLKLHPFWNNAKAVQVVRLAEADSLPPRSGGPRPEGIRVNVYTAGNEALLIAANHTQRKTPVALALDLPALGLSVREGGKLEITDAEKDATWGKTVADAYLKHIYTGPTLLSDEERRFSFDHMGAKAHMEFTVDARDYRVFLIQAP